MGTRKIAGTQAWVAATNGPATRWSRHIERFSAEVAEVAHQPKFTIASDDSIFCIGSCFARNIEEHLIYGGANVLSRRVISPKAEWSARPNGFVNKFTTHSMRNELEWVKSPPELDACYFEEQAGGWLDLQLSPHVKPVPLERAIERRAYLTRDYFSRIQQASLVIVTLGLCEVWFDRASGRHLNAAPSFSATKREPDRFEFHVTDVADNLGQLTELRQLIRSLNADARMLVTVSPVPLSETFSGRDVLVANSYSKATLRAAADMFADAHPDVDYFPSFDIVTMSPRSSAYDADCLHVSDRIVSRMMQMFLRLYRGSSGEPPNFSEDIYLEANPDVEAALRRGELASGFEHWTRFGRSEGRWLRA